MKQSGKVAICLAGGLVLSVSARALTADGQGNPYQSVVERNVFALKPAPRPEDNPPPKPPTPPIELQGITSMFGRKQVLFAATMPGSKQGEPAKKTSMVLKVGEREGEIEVLEIDEKAGSVKFNNHGTEEVKFLEKDSAKLVPTTAPTPFPGISVPGGVPPPAARVVPGAPGNSSVTTFGGSTLRNIPSRPTRGPMMASGAPVTAPAATTTPQVAQPKLPSPEEQAALMLINHASGGPPPPPIPGLTD